MCRASVAKRAFSQLDHRVYDQLRHWAHFRHPHQSGGWRYWRYWKRPCDRIEFTDGTRTLEHHEDIRIVRHVKVPSDKSPYDGDWVYWGARLGRDPTQSPRVLRLLKEQPGRCGRCGLRLTTEDVLEVHHKDGHHNNKAGLTWRYCTPTVTTRNTERGIYDNDPYAEEPCECESMP